MGDARPELCTDDKRLSTATWALYVASANLGASKNSIGWKNSFLKVPILVQRKAR